MDAADRAAPNGGSPPPISTPGRRWAARAALGAATAALLTPLIFAGLHSLVLLAIGAAGLAVAMVGLWWALTHQGPVRVAGECVAVLAIIAVAAIYIAHHFLWIVLLAAGLWLVAGVSARAALRGSDARMHEYDVAPPKRPFIVMNPRSGGGKVGRFDLVNRARALGAEVAVLEGPGHVDVAALARDAVAGGADLLGVAGGDGTQALIAGIAVEYDLPFLVISAGTRNHFALDLGLDRDDPSRCLDALTDGVELHVDLGAVNGRPFVNTVSFGAYAAVVQSAAYRDAKTRTALRELPDLLLGHVGPRLHADAGRVRIDGPQAVLVSNNPYSDVGTGDLAGLGRRPRLDHGHLGVVGIRIDSAIQAAGLLRGAGLTTVVAREVTVHADAADIPVGVDGEALILPTPVRCVSRPGVLRVRVPRDRPGRVIRPPLDWHRVRQLAGGLIRHAGTRHVG
ncbi:MAG TPA: diacylglycerol kinase family protein [Micromonosporaceae bacterium]|jgi:diacylglycerol kinase family enzyme